MNVLSLFDGMSCGQIALVDMKMSYGVYYASEVDKHAIKQTQLNFPNTIQLGDVRDIDVSQLKPIDLLIGGSPCFGSGTKVLTDEGYKDIESIKVGDSVLTHKNRFRKVLNVGGKTADTYILKIHGAVDTIVTGNHPYYARKKESLWVNEMRTRRTVLNDPEWIPAESLPKNYRVAHVIPEVEENPLCITRDEAFIIGRYIADGHTRKDYRKSEGRPNDRHWQLILSVGEGKVDEFNTSLHFSKYKHSESTYRIVFSNKRLVEIVEKHCGCGAENKFFSETLINLPNDILMEIFNGYISGDGCIINDVIQCSSISKMLAITLQRVVLKLFGVSLTITKDSCAGKRVILGREINQKDCYIMRFNPSQSDKNYINNDGFYVWVNAKKLTPYKKTRVYNIEVEEDNSYTANGVVVHNCQSFSFAGKRNGMTTKCEVEITRLDQYLELKAEGFEFEGQSYLFWEYMRILTDIRKYNPDVLFLLENVEMGKKWERVLSEAIGIYGVHINSALVSAQNRKRIYWTNIRVKKVGLFGELHSDIPQPADRGILLKDILEPEVDEKYYIKSESMLSFITDKWRQDKAYTQINGDKSLPQMARQYSSWNGDYIADSVCVSMVGRKTDENGTRKDNDPNIKAVQRLEPNHNGKTNCLTSVQKDNLVMQINPSLESGGKQPYQQNRIYDSEGISPALCANKSDLIIKQNYAVIGEGYEQDNRAYFEEGKSGTLDLKSESRQKVLLNNYRIRRLTPKECARLQTIPEWYRWECSVTQAYRMLGNGWTVEVIKWIFSFTKT